MIFKYTESYVDDEPAESNIWNVDLTKEEADQLGEMLHAGYGYIEFSDDEEQDYANDKGEFIFRGKAYTGTVTDILDDIGEKITPDYEVSYYVY